MDTLYIGDIPSEYHYAVFHNNGYIDLYNTDNIVSGNRYNFYRVYTNLGGFYYEYLGTTYTGTIRTTNIVVSNNPCYRDDFANIMIMTFIFVLFGVWLFNLFTSLINKGGVLGGLL